MEGMVIGQALRMAYMNFNNCGIPQYFAWGAEQGNMQVVRNMQMAKDSMEHVVMSVASMASTGAPRIGAGVDPVSLGWAYRLYLAGIIAETEIRGLWNTDPRVSTSINMAYGVMQRVGLVGLLFDGNVGRVDEEALIIRVSEYIGNTLANQYPQAIPMSLEIMRQEMMWSQQEQGVAAESALITIFNLVRGYNL